MTNQAEEANYRESLRKKEVNAYRRAARKAGETSKQAIVDCTLPFVVKDGWFPAVQNTAVACAIRAAKNAFRAHPELRETK